MTPITYAMAYLMDKGHKPTRHIIARNQAEVVAALKGGE